jgi:hypothetical protein
MRRGILSSNRRIQRAGGREVLHALEGFSSLTTASPEKEKHLMSQFSLIVSSPIGVVAALALAAYLEVQGDACFQSGLHHSVGAKQMGWFAVGTVVLVCYTLFLNSSKIDFGKLLGIYVVLFFVVAQIVAKLQFHQSPSKPIYIGGAFIMIGGLIMALWKA